MISAHYGLSDVFDNLIISLCKFTALSSEVSCKEGKEVWLSICWSSLPHQASDCFLIDSVWGPCFVLRWQQFLSKVRTCKETHSIVLRTCARST